MTPPPSPLLPVGSVAPDFTPPVPADQPLALAELRADSGSGVRSGVNGTPSFFVNGCRYDGDWSDVGGFAADLLAAADAGAGARAARGA